MTHLTVIFTKNLRRKNNEKLLRSYEDVSSLFMKAKVYTIDILPYEDNHKNYI